MISRAPVERSVADDGEVVGGDGSEKLRQSTHFGN